MSPAFNSLQDFLLMSGHGVYVWLAWGLALPILASLLILPRLRRRRLLAELRRRDTTGNDRGPSR